MHLEASPNGYYAKIPPHQCLYRHTLSGRYYAIKKLFGKRRETSLGTTDRKIAERRLKEWIGGLEKIDGVVEKTTVRPLREKLIAANVGKSASTQYIIRSVSEEFQRAFGAETQVRNIRPSHLDEWLARQEQRLKNSSYNRVAGVLKQFFEIAVKDRIIGESPFAKAKTRWKKPHAPERRVPTLEQFYALVESIRGERSRFAGDTGDFIEFIGEAGMGQAETASLTWGQVDWQRDCLHIRRHKTNTWFPVPIYAHLRPLLERLRASAGVDVRPGVRVFKILDGKKALTAACKQLGYHHFSQRNMRQCLIGRLWRAGVDRKLIAKWQGHQDGGALILHTYTEVFADDDSGYERQQLAKIAPQPAQATPIQPAPVGLNRQPSAHKFLGMENPFKPNEIVMTKVKGADVTATVVQVFNNEVQVKTWDGKLLWRTIHTVWYPGALPIPKPQKPKVEAVPAPAPAASAPAENTAQPDGTPPAESTETRAGGESTAEPAAAPAPVGVPAKGSKRRKHRAPRL